MILLVLEKRGCMPIKQFYEHESLDCPSQLLHLPSGLNAIALKTPLINLDDVDSNVNKIDLAAFFLSNVVFFYDFV